MKKVVSVRIGQLGKFGLENGQRTMTFKKKEYEFKVGDVIAFYCTMDGMDLPVKGKYEVTKTDYGKEGPYGLISFRKIRDCEDE